jgi:N-acetylglucosaminyl-diphospho-decaprenol L-rhamnosyltransferase
VVQLADPPTVSAIVLNYVNDDQTLECVRSLLAQDYPALDVVVVDNCSPNGSEERLRAALGGEARVAVLQTGENRGYAAGNNAGCRWRAERSPVAYFLIANNDVLVDDTTTITRMVAFAQSNPDLGGVGPRVMDARGLTTGPYGRPDVWIKGLRLLFPVAPYLSQLWRRRRPPRQVVMRTYSVVGAFILLKAAPFLETGMFDEATFLGAEEYILAERLARAGLAMYHYPLVTVTHNHGRSVSARQGRHGWAVYQRGVDSMVYYFREYQRLGVGSIAFYRTVALLYGRLIFPFRGRFV